MEKLFEYLPYILPYLAVSLILNIFTTVHMFRHKTLKIGNRWIWLPVVWIFQLIGPIAYFLVGRGEDE